MELFEMVKKNITNVSTYTKTNKNLRDMYSIQIKRSGEEITLSMHFSLKKPLNVDNHFEFEKKEFIQDTHLQYRTANLTLEEGFWPKIRSLHEYDDVDGKITKTTESVIIKKVFHDQENEHIQKLELTITQFHGLVINTCWTAEPLDMVVTMRQIYHNKDDPSIKLILGSTGIDDYKFYNHGTIKCNLDKEEEMLEILTSFGDSISFPQSSPVYVRLKYVGKLPPNISLIRTNTDLNDCLCEEGFYYDKDEEEDEEEEEIEELLEILTKTCKRLSQILNK